MKKQKGKKKAFLAVLLSAAVICQTFPTYSLAAQGPDGICPHHTEHTAQCGYREAAAEVPCNHQHTEECYKTETNCLHQHTEECYPLVPSETDETQQVRGSEPTACTHVCSEESGCITKKEACTHVQVNEDGTTTLLHDEKCGYVAAQEAAACQFVCEECKNTAAESERLAAEKAAQESQQKIDNVQSLISALPEAEGITAENLEDVKAQLAAIEAAKAELNETQQASLQMEKYTAAVERVAVVEGELEAERAEAELAAQEAQQKIDNVQSLISALPEADSITAENLEDVKAQLAAIEAAKAELNETQQASLQMEKYTVAVERVAVVEAERAEAELAAQEAQQKIDNVQSLISALPEAEDITAENLEDVKAQLTEIEAAKAALDESQQAALNLEKYNAAVERIAALEAEPQKAPANTQEAGNDVATVTIDGEEKGYPTLAEAITAADGKTATITLLQSIDETGDYYDIRGGNITLNLNGCSVGNPFYVYGGFIKVIGEGGLVWISFLGDGIEAVIESGNITTLTASDSSKVTISGGDVKTFNVNQRATAIITGGNIQVLNASVDGSGNITVKGGTIESITDTVSSINYEPQSVTLDKNTLSLKVNEQGSLTATVTPNISAPGFPVWKSNNEAVATVNNGIVTAVGAGETTITVTAGEKTATCTVTVVEDYVATVTIDGEETGYYPTLAEAIKAADGKTATITLLQSTDKTGTQYYINGGNITLNLNGCSVGNAFYFYGGFIKVIGEGKLHWMSFLNDTEAIIESGNITTISVPGKVTISGGDVETLYVNVDGTAIITGGNIHALNGSYDGSGNITVKGGTIESIADTVSNINYEPQSVTLDKNTLSLKVNEQGSLTATVTPNISAPGFPVWESSNTDVATVNNGSVTAVAPGEAIITVIAGNKSAECKVTVGDVASVTLNGKTQNYTDLDDAAKVVSGTGGTLTLLKDVSGRTQPLELSGPMTFDLGGHTLSGAWEDDPYGGLLEITSGVVGVKNGNVSVPGDTGVLCCAIAVREGATLSGNATYSANAWGDVVYNKGTIREGNFHGSCNLYGTVQGGNFHTSSIQMFGKIEGGNFNNTGGNSNLDRPREVGFGPDGVILGGTFTNLKFMYGVNGLFQGGIFNNCVFSSIRDDYFSGETNLAPGYVAYDTSGKIVIDRQPQIKLPPMYFTGTIEPHKSHTYNYTTSEDGNGNYTCSENTCPICGITAPEGAAYTVTIPKTAQLGSGTEVSVNNSLSQEKTVTVSVNETQVTLTRENDPEQTQIVSDVTFEDISVTKGQKDTEKVIFAPPVYNNDPDALIPAGTYKGTLTFTIGMQ